jgi:hypothetical protein
MTKITLSEETSEALREVARMEQIDPDTLVRMWCIVALPAGPMEENIRE